MKRSPTRVIRERAQKWMRGYVRDYLDIYFKNSTPLFDAAMSARFKVARSELGLSQSEMAKRIGLTQTDISRIEAGKCLTTGVKTEQFKTALGDYFKYVIVGGGKPVRLTTNNEQFAGENYWKGKKSKG